MSQKLWRLFYEYNSPIMYVSKKYSDKFNLNNRIRINLPIATTSRVKYVSIVNGHT